MRRFLLATKEFAVVAVIMLAVWWCNERETHTEAALPEGGPTTAAQGDAPVPTSASALGTIVPNREERDAYSIQYIEAKLLGEGFNLAVNYGERLHAYERCEEEAPVEIWGDEGAMRARCGSAPEFPFACVVSFERFMVILGYLERDAPVQDRKRVQRALAWALEEPRVFFCEDIAHVEPEPDYERAYALYQLLDDVAGQRHVAALRAEELMDGVCREAFVSYDSYDDRHTGEVQQREPPRCDPSRITMAEQWLARANRQPDNDWYARILGQSKWALMESEEHPQLACDAIAIAERAGVAGIEHLRRIRLAYGVQCAANTMPTR